MHMQTASAAGAVVHEHKTSQFFWVWGVLLLITAIEVYLGYQNLQPVKDASCKSTVHWPDGHFQEFTLVTNVNGFGLFPLAFENQPHGSLIYTDVICAYNALSGTTTTSYRIWY